MGTALANFTQRVIGAARLRPAAYEDVEHDQSALLQALTIVVLSSAAAAIGAGIQVEAAHLIRAAFAALFSWIVWASLVFFIGTKIFGTPNTRTTLGEVLRTTGFAASPGLLSILGVIPFASGVVFLAVSIWMLVTFVFAVQAALDYRNIWRAVAVCFTGWVVYVVFGIFIF